MKIFVKKIDGVELPVQGNPDDAAYDITATSEPNIVGVKFERPLDGINAWQKIDYIEYKTNLFIAPQSEYKVKQNGSVLKKFHTLLHPRSSISKKNLVLANSIGLVDNGYRGEICFRFKYIFQPEDFIILPEHGRNRVYGILNPDNIYKMGDRIGQIKAQPNVPIQFIFAESLDVTTRNEGGFGSTG